MMNIYIRSAACIAPAAKPAGNRLACIEPDYKGLIDPKALRRMSRIIRMSVATAMNCLSLAGGPKAAAGPEAAAKAEAAGPKTAGPEAPGGAGIAIPDAIVTGTGYGCLEDTGVFLANMIQRNEEALQPATFIQSTHNTVGAQIALILQCTGYNNTFVHRGFSFENAVLDAILLLQEGEATTVLTGGVDELTDASFAILSRFGWYRQALAGEGAAFFLLSGEPGGDDYAKLEGVATFYKPENPKEIAREIGDFLQELAVDPASIDLVIGEEILSGIPTQPYKTQCGEYPTSTAYALWLAARLIKSGAHKRILVYNHYLGIHHAAFLLTAVS
jgi:hypothetical protein